MNTDMFDPFALGGTSEGDAELFALIAEYRRLEQSANEHGIVDDERERRCDQMRPFGDKIEAIRPVTLAGVLAVLDLGSDLLNKDPHHWPDEAIEGLRDIAAKGGAA